MGFFRAKRRKIIAELPNIVYIMNSALSRNGARSIPCRTSLLTAGLQTARAVGWGTLARATYRAVRGGALLEGDTPKCATTRGQARGQSSEERAAASLCQRRSDGGSGDYSDYTVTTIHKQSRSSQTVT